VHPNSNFQQRYAFTAVSHVAVDAHALGENACDDRTRGDAVYSDIALTEFGRYAPCRVHHRALASE